MAASSSIIIRRARRDDVRIIVEMLADDPLGSAREKPEEPLPPSYFQAFEKVDRDDRLQLVVAEDADGKVVGCLQLCVMPGLSSQGASRGLIEEQLVQWAVGRARAKGCVLVELLTHHTRVDAQRFYERLGFARSHIGMTIRL
jgi:GNAT superfamily N-acetyltransferase